MIELSKIHTDGGTQARAEIHDETVAEYAEAMESPETVFPPVVVYYDGKDYWLADGFHRVAAWERAGRLEVPADVRQGDRRRAILHSVAANSAHGLRRSNADKRRAVMTLLDDEEWSHWSARQIAKQCGVSPDFVARMKREQQPEVSSDDTLTHPETEVAQPVEQTDAQEQEQPAALDREPDALETATEPAEPQPDDADPQPEPEPDPYGYARLAADALLDTANGLRTDLDEAKAKVKALRVERDDLKAKWQEVTTDSDMGRALGNAQRQRDTAKGRLGEEQAKNARQSRRIKALEAERNQLRKSLGDQEIAL